MNERDENERDETPEAGVPAEEIDCPSGAVVRTVPFHGTAAGYEDEFGHRVVSQAEANAEAIEVLRREFDRAIMDLKERVSELEHTASAHGEEESIQILDLRTRLVGLVRRVDELELVTETASPSERESDLERALGMRNAENRALEKELAAARATRDRAVSESSSRGVRLEELESQIDDFESRSTKTLEAHRLVGAESRRRYDEITALEREELEIRGRAAKVANALQQAEVESRERGVRIEELEESVRRKDAQIAGFVEEVKKLRGRPTFDASAEAVVELVLDHVESGHENAYIPGNELGGVLEKVEGAMRRAADTPTPVSGFAVVFETGVVDPADDPEMVLEDFGEKDFDGAAARFDELAKTLPTVLLAGIVRRS